MHGAGLGQTMYLPLGTKYCCGVVELFPGGQFKNSRGYEVMSTRLGYTYKRFDLNMSLSGELGTTIPVLELIASVEDVVKSIVKKGGSCISPEVIQEPYM